MRISRFKRLMCLLLIIPILGSLPQAYAVRAYSDNEQTVKQNFIDAYGWDSDKIDAFEWTGINGKQYERSSDYEENMFADVVKTHELLAVDYGIMSLSDMNGTGGAMGIVAVALGEVVAEDNMETPPGSNNCKYNTWFYGHPVSGEDYAWCAVFISWCAEQCGYISGGLFPQNCAYCDTYYSYMTQNNGFTSCYIMDIEQFGGSALSAVPGDLVFYCNTGERTSQYGHIGLVTAVGDGYIDITQGNTYSTVMTIRTTTAEAGSDSRLSGGGQLVHVEYPDDSLSIFLFLTKQMDFNTAAACGVLGNLQVESGCIPYRIEGDNSAPYEASQEYTAEVDGGSISEGEFVGLYSGYGLVQWTYPTRKQGLYNLCKNSGTVFSIGDVSAQISFIKQELQNEYPELISLMQGVPNTESGARQAAGYWNSYYERGINPNGIREDYASSFWSQYGASA